MQFEQHSQSLKQIRKHSEYIYLKYSWLARPHLLAQTQLRLHFLNDKTTLKPALNIKRGTKRVALPGWLEGKLKSGLFPDLRGNSSQGFFLTWGETQVRAFSWLEDLLVIWCFNSCFRSWISINVFLVI